MRALRDAEASLLRAVGTLTAPGGRRGSLLVLVFHRVLPTPDPLLESEPDAIGFAAELDLIARVCNVLPLHEAIERLVRGSLPSRAVSITFDDGYANNLTVAAPILQARRLPATVFIATGYIGQGCMWNDTVIESVRRAGERLDLRDLGLAEFALSDVNARRSAISDILGALKHRAPDERLACTELIAQRVDLSKPSGLMMTEEQIRALSAFGIDVGAHTVTHPILKGLPVHRATREIAESKATLEAITRAPVTLFAYPNGKPNGDFDRTHVEMVRTSGFEAAFSTAWGAAGRDTDRYQIPRMLPWDRSPLRYALRLLFTHRQQAVETAA